MKAGVAIGLLIATGACAHAPPGAVSNAQCVVSPAEHDANRAKDWPSFDLDANLAKGAMWLSARGCYREAGEAGLDYLAHGPVPSTSRAHSSLLLHIARNLARAGDRARAHVAASAALRPDQPTDAKLDWNSYVRGFAAYLAGDRSTTLAMRDRLVSAGGESNLTNAAVLSRTLACFDRPFLEVETNAACAPR